MIRHATIDDIDRLVEMGEQFRSSTRYQQFIAGSPTSMRQLANFLIQQQMALMLVDDVDGEVSGMIGAVIYAHPISGERIASEMVWWVDPKCRGNGLRLFDAMEQWAVKNGATTLQMIAPSESVERLYRRMGFQPVERLYQRPLRHSWREKESA